MREAVVADGVRTPFGRAGRRGMFRTITHVDLMVPLLKHILERNKLDPKDVDEVHVGSVMLTNPITKARHYLYEAGLPESIWGTDVNTQCASALQTVVEGCQAVACGSADVVVAGGIETMDRTGVVTAEEMAGQPPPQPNIFPPKSEIAYPEDWKDAELIPWWFNVKSPLIMNMLWTAENLHERFNVSRQEADDIKENMWIVLTPWKLREDGEYDALIEALSLMPENIFLNIDLDVMDPSEAPGVGNPEPGGIGWYELLDVLYITAREKNLVAADVVEFLPLEDDRVTLRLAARLVEKLASVL